MIREWDGFNFAFAVVFDNRIRNFLERFRFSGAEVENARNAVFATPKDSLLPHLPHKQNHARTALSRQIVLDFPLLTSGCLSGMPRLPLNLCVAHEARIR